MILMGMSIPLEAIRRQIASGIDVLVHLGRLRDGSRKVLEIVEMVGYENGEFILNPLYGFEEVKVEESGSVVGTLCKKGELIHGKKLAAAGMQLL